jgi:outer membrane protein assembly factor BamA
MRTFSRALPTLFLLFALPALSQTYTPKQILIKGADGMDTQQIIGITALKPGSMTKQDIEAALQRLADTGLFNDLNYTVSSDALAVTVTPSAAAQLVPVRFTNFIWWTPSELNVLIQARVPLYQGKLSLKGSMIEQVEAALVAILKQKGIDAEVTPIEGISGNSLALAISRPSIVLGNIDVQGSLPTVASKLADIKTGFAEQEFDQQVLAKSIPLNVTDLYNNAGFLDATTDPAAFATPRKGKDAYLVDASTTVHPGELYRIRQLTFNGPPPLSHADMEKATALKVSEPAGVFTIQHASDALANAYSQHGFLDAKSKQEFPKDASTHTVDVTFTVTPGEIYHLASIDASSLPPNVQAAIAKDSKLRPGVVADQEVTQEILQILAQRPLMPGASLRMKKDRDHQLVTIALVLPASRL